MEIATIKTGFRDIQALRELFLEENQIQFIHNAFHERGWSDCFLIQADGQTAGYAAVRGNDNWQTERTTIFEFYTLPAYRQQSSLLFPALFALPGVQFIGCQSNDLLLSSMLYEFAKDIEPGRILFKDKEATSYGIPEISFRARREEDIIFKHLVEGAGDYVLELQQEIVATGGFMLHYNKPYADLYMEVSTLHRCKGLGSFLLQELKKVAYNEGRIPAARCNPDNQASKACLLKAGLVICGYELTGHIKNGGSTKAV